MQKALVLASIVVAGLGAGACSDRSDKGAPSDTVPPVCALPTCFDTASYPIVSENASALEVAAKASPDIRNVYDISMYLPDPTKGEYETSADFVARKRKLLTDWNYAGFSEKTRFAIAVTSSWASYDPDRGVVSISILDDIGARPSTLEISNSSTSTSSTSSGFQDGSSMRVREQKRVTEGLLFTNILRPTNCPKDGLGTADVDFDRKPDSPEITFKQNSAEAQAADKKYVVNYVVSFERPSAVKPENWCYQTSVVDRAVTLEAGGLHASTSSLRLVNVRLHRIVVTGPAKDRVLWERSFD